MNWYGENKLRAFLAKNLDLCHSSAATAVRTYSPPPVKRQYEATHDGIKSLALSTTIHQD